MGYFAIPQGTSGENSLDAVMTVAPIDNTVSIAAATGPMALSNSADATDLITLARSFAGVGQAIDIDMGAATTGEAVNILFDAGGGIVLDASVIAAAAPAVSVQDPGNDDNVDLTTAGLEGYGTNLDFILSTRLQTGVGIAARDLVISGGRGSPGDGGTVSGAGANVDLVAGDAGVDGGAGVGAGGDITFDARGAAVPIPINGPAAGDVDLTGFTATSIVGALNELRAITAPATEATGARALADTDHETTILCTAAGGCTITVPDTVTPGLTVMFIQRGAAQVTVVGGGAMTIVQAPTFLATTAEIGSPLVIYVESGTVANVFGDLAV